MVKMLKLVLVNLSKENKIPRLGIVRFDRRVECLDQRGKRNFCRIFSNFERWDVNLLG